MDTVNIHEAKTHLSRLVSRAARGESFIIAKAGKPLAKVVPYSAAAPKKAKRIGFLVGSTRIPKDFDRFAEDEIEALFGAKS